MQINFTKLSLETKNLKQLHNNIYRTLNAETNLNPEKNGSELKKFIPEFQNYYSDIFLN